jgi:peptidylglycine monooxygenase
MILFGCKAPGRPNPIYHCGAMDASQDEDTPATTPCSNGTSIVYAWAQNAPKLHLPKDVAFKVGGQGSKVDYLVLQVKPFIDKEILETRAGFVGHIDI